MGTKKDEVTEFDRNLGMSISKVRTNKKKETQAAAAAAVGVNLQTYQHWEAGTRKIKAEHLLALAKHFEVSVDYLLGNAPARSTNPDVQVAMEYTGLSEESVKALRFQSSYSAGTPNIVITLINTLLENRGSMQRATKDIYRSALLNFHDTRKTQHNTAQSVEELLHGIPEQLSVTDMKKLDNQIKTKALANFRSNKNWTIEVPADIASKLYEDRAAARFDKMVREAIGRYTSELSKLVVQIDDDPCGGE